MVILTVIFIISILVFRGNMDAGNNSSSANLSIAIGRELDVCEDDRENGGLSISTFIVGSEFHSFDEVSSAIKDYECVNSVTLYTRSSRSIMTAKKRAPKRHFSENLKYSELDYACVHGSRQYKSHSKGIRKSQSTFLKECPFIIKIRTSVLKEVSGDHNHELSKEAF